MIKIRELKNNAMERNIKKSTSIQNSHIFDIVYLSLFNYDGQYFGG